MLAAAVLTHALEPRAVQRDFWRRALDPRRLGAGGAALALFVHPAIVGAAIVAERSIGGVRSELAWPEGGALGLVSLAFFTIWFGPLPEELGWRGYALDRLRARFGALTASLVLGTAWAAWHVPLFFVPGTFQRGLGLGSARSLVFLASMLPLSVVMTWVYERTRRSTLSAVLVHATGNLCGALVSKTTRLAAFELVGLALAAAAIVIALGPRHFGPRESSG